MSRLGSAAIRLLARLFASRDLRVRLFGAEHLPKYGPALLVCRHFHHVYDGVALLDGLPRLPHLFVALDWIRDPVLRLTVEGLCGLAEWPAALRAENLSSDPSAFSQREAPRYVRRALHLGARLLRRGEVVAAFPEGYPTIDPVFARKPEGDGYLPFKRGFLTMTALAQRAGDIRVPLIPTGLRYVRHLDGWDVDIRLGPANYLDPRTNRDILLARLALQVRALST
jgi:putative membrane protein